MKRGVFVVGFLRGQWQRAQVFRRSISCAPLLVSGLLLLATLACTAKQPYIWASRYGAQETSEADRPLGPGDQISVQVADQVPLSGTFTLGADGSYSQPVVGSILLSGMTLRQAEAELKTRLTGILVQPRVTLSLVKRRPLHVGVIGEVKQGGRFAADFNEGVLSLISRAGGLTEYADEDSIYVVRREPQLLRIRFRFRDLAAPDPVSASFRLAEGDVVVVE